MTKSLINIAIPNTSRTSFTYSSDAQLAKTLRPGQRLAVPFGRRQLIGFYLGEGTITPGIKIKNILSVIDEKPLFSAKFLKFISWMAEYYYADIGDVLLTALPPELRKAKKLKNPRSGKSPDNYGQLLGYALSDDIPDDIDTDAIDNLKKSMAAKTYITRSEILSAGISEYKYRKYKEHDIIKPVYGMPKILPYVKPRPGIDKLTPTDEQQHAINKIATGLDKYSSTLLYGITGSGKTLVYCHIAKQVLAENKSVLFLVPEIALAGTLLASLRAYFPDQVAVMHSALKPKERLWVWKKVHDGDFKVVVGARSAIFAPLQKPGLIIVDEEHDESYKQDDPAPRFHARDAAIMRAKMLDIPIILGSATPSFESFHNAQKERHQLIRLTKRPEKAKTPMVRLVDLKHEHFHPDRPYFSAELKSGIKKSLEKNNQVILYLNRRGFSPRMKCISCGHTPECPYCMVPLAYHKKGNRLVCHLCDYSAGSYEICSNCRGAEFLYLGSGTQKIENALPDILENARVVRLDSDNARQREQVHITLNDFAKKKYDILLGTQMVTKGIDFPDVSLVGVLMADLGLDMPDFRAPEKLFAKLIQVSGRSGRGIIPGEVIIQTFQPELDLIDDAARQDYDSFYDREIEGRKNLKYPPFSHLVNFRISGKNETSVKSAALKFKTTLEKHIKLSKQSAIILGPATCHFYRLRGSYRRHVLIKTRSVTSFIKSLKNWQNKERNWGLPSSIKIVVDVDPHDMM